MPSRERVPTLAEFRKVCRDLFGSHAYVYLAEFAGNVTIKFGKRAEDRSAAYAALKALAPDGPPGRKKT